MNRNEKAAGNNLSTASLVFGILGILTSWTVVLAIPNALMALCFSALSKGAKKKCNAAVAGTIFAAASLVIAGIAAFVFLDLAVDFINSLSGSREEIMRNLLNGIRSLEGV